VGVDPKLFDFVTDLVNEVNEDGDGIDGSMGGDSNVITFGEGLFDQFFGSIGHNITGFSASAKRRAIRFVEELPDGDSPEVRRLVVAFEEFCDLATDAHGNYSGSSVPYAKAIALVERILVATETWVGTLPNDALKPPLLARVQQARSEIEAIM
jgi:hypothetical protein